MTAVLERQSEISRGLLCVETWNPAAAAPDLEFDYIDIASIDRDQKAVTSWSRIVAAEAPSRARQIVRTGDVLVSTVRPNLNAVAFVPRELNGATASTGFCVLRCDPQIIEPRYLFHWVRSPQFVAAISRQATGASYPAVTDGMVKGSRMPMPAAAEQQRIADILDKADAIKLKQQRFEGYLKQLGIGVFFEMFRDFVFDDAKSKRLEQVAGIASGVAKGRRFNGAQTVHVPYLRVANVQAGFLDLRELKTIEALPQEVETLALNRGDVVMTEGGDHDKLGRGALWDADVPNCIHQNHIFRVRADRSRLLPVFFATYLQTERATRYFLRAAKKTSNLATINMRQLKALPVPVPPIELQRSFDKAAGQIRELTDRQNLRCNAAADLFASLAQRAFRGDL